MWSISVQELLNKIFQNLQELPRFYGEYEKLHAWIELVDSALGIFAYDLNSEIYAKYSQYIRTKVQGQANEKLNAAGVRENSLWFQIKQTLLETSECPNNSSESEYDTEEEETHIYPVQALKECSENQIATKNENDSYPQQNENSFDSSDIGCFDEQRCKNPKSKIVEKVSKVLSVVKTRKVEKSLKVPKMSFSRPKSSEQEMIVAYNQETGNSSLNSNTLNYPKFAGKPEIDVSHLASNVSILGSVDVNTLEASISDPGGGTG